MAITTTRYATFNGYNLNNITGLSVYKIDLPGQQQRSVNIMPMGARDARKVSSAYYQRNTLNIGIYITSASSEALELALDTLYTNLQAVEAPLIVPMSGRTARQYTATYLQSTITQRFGGFVELTLTFECSDSFGYDQFFTPMLTLANQTSTPNQWNWTFSGSVLTQVPYLQFYFTAGSLGSGTVTVGNLTTGQSVSINRSFAVGDTLQIDAKNITVQVNGVDVQFTGSIPTFGTGLQTITYSDTFTSRTFQLYSYVYYRWI